MPYTKANHENIVCLFAEHLGQTTLKIDEQEDGYKWNLK